MLSGGWRLGNAFYHFVVVAQKLIFYRKNRLVLRYLSTPIFTEFYSACERQMISDAQSHLAWSVIAPFQCQLPMRLLQKLILVMGTTDIKPYFKSFSVLLLEKLFHRVGSVSICCFGVAEYIAVLMSRTNLEGIIRYS